MEKKALPLAAALLGLTLACSGNVQVFTFDGVRPWREIGLKAGLRHGPFREFSEAGVLLETGEYRHGRLAGTWRLYYPTGAKRANRYYQDGLRHGIWTEWYPSGAKASESTWVRGDRQGRVQIWAEDGTLIEEQHWELGTRVEVHKP